MNSNFYFLLSFLLVLPGCFDTTSLNDKKHTYFIQAPFEATIISRMQEHLSPVINKIIKEEAHLESEKDLPLFFFKKRAAISIYYINDMLVNAQSLLFASLEGLKKFPKPKSITLSSKVHFFGELKEDRMALLDLVVEIHDPNKELSLLNHEAKEIVNALNEKYKSTYRTDMYDSAKSERYSFLPHLSLGHLRANYIKHTINNPSIADKVIDRIKERIIEAISNFLSNLPSEDKKIIFEKLSIYDLKKRIYIKDFEFKKRSLL